jgi:curved DNA-binding protein CbpA
MKDYYKILHVSVNATSEEIEESYKILSEEYRPEEHYPEESYHVRYYKEIQEAYRVLSDNVKRATYTKELLENEDKVEDIEKRHREEGFGDVLKLLLDDPKNKKKTKRAKPAKSLSRIDFKTPLIIVGCLVLLGFLVYLVFDNWNYINNNISTTQEIPVEEVSGSEEGNTTLLEENLYGTGEENYEPSEEETDGQPYELNEEVSEDIASLSLTQCLELLSNESIPFEKKEDAITRALQFFDGKNVNVRVIGSNNVQIRRETIEDYLFILMLQGYDVQIVNAAKNQEGKITEVSIKENL